MSTSFLRSAAVALLVLSAAPSQSLPTGYRSELLNLPPNAAYTAVLPNGVAWFDGSDLVLLENGQAPRSLLHFAPPRFGAFTLPLANGALVFADSSIGQVWLVPTVANSAPVLLTTLVLPYDAAQVAPGRIVVSAKTGGYAAADNDLVAIDLASGATALLGSVPGASGALAIDALGGIVYATAPATFPPPAGSVQVLRWSAAQVQLAQLGAGPLGHANARILCGGLDAVGDLALDSDDDLLFIDWMNGRLGEIDDLNSIAASSSFVDYSVSSLSCGTLQFVGSHGALEPFALGSDATLWVHETDYANTSQLRAVRPRGAALTPSVPGVIPRGPFALQLQDAPANGLTVFALAIAASRTPITLGIPGFEQSIGWDLGLVNGPTLLTPLGANGGAQIVLNNPGLPLGLQLLAGCAFTDASLRVLGASPVVPMPLAP